MVPFITRGGANFRRAWLYFCHDKQASTSERVEWIEFRNLLTDCSRQAWQMMEYTYKSRQRLKQSAGRGGGGNQVSKPCYSYSLSWHPDETPSRDEMIALADESLRVLGLEDHQAMIVCHTDEPHPHVHLVINRIHPETGLAASPSYSRRKLSDLALTYEQSQDSIRCPARVRRKARSKSDRGELPHREVIAKAWFGSTDVREFISHLEGGGYQFVKDGQRILLIGPQGEIINPVRHLEGVSSREFHAAMGQVVSKDFSSLEESNQPGSNPSHPRM